MINKYNSIFKSHYFIVVIFIIGCDSGLQPLGENEPIRVYTEFADGTNRGMYDPDTDSNGFPDEDFDATTAMVINWHKMPETEPDLDARLRYRSVYPTESRWISVQGKTFDYWYRDEKINRVILTDLVPNTVYEFRMKEEGDLYRLQTMPSNLDERDVKIVMTADHQSPGWPQTAHDNAKMTVLHQPDMFVVAGDYINDEGEATEENANRWALYLDTLYGVEDGYFLYDKEIDGQIFENLVIPHVTVLGNHETGKQNHMRWPVDLLSGSGPGYQEYVNANWIELLFHWPYSSEGFYNEFNPEHPNMAKELIQEGFGHGGFGKLSFSDYLLLIALDNSQNWEGEPDTGLRDWKGNLITDKWPWYETHHADVRQDLWLKNLLEPENKPSAGEIYKHILPVWHRGLFGTVRQNMSLKNRNLLKYWLPILYRNGTKLIKEAHDHSYARTVPMSIYSSQPENTYLEKVYYQPNTWDLTGNLSQEYIDDFFAVNSLKDNDTGEIIGWEFDGNFITHAPKGMIVTGHGGWSAGRRELGHWGGGNAGLWYVDEEKGGEAIAGYESFHINIVHLTNDDLTIETIHPNQLTKFESEMIPEYIHRFRWSINNEKWMSFDPISQDWIDY